MLKIHNMLEDVVIEQVNQLYDQVKQKESSWLTCDCENCRLDTICYVLNRLPNNYVVSGRGVTHSFLNNNTQLSVDINKLCIEGMRLVSSAKRPYHTDLKNSIKEIPESENATYNFPTFFGNIFDGNTFEPLINARVLLRIDNEVAEMMDVTWPNPCVTYEATKGSYTFWIAPISAKEEKLKREFNFKIEVTAYGYEDTQYSFSIPLVSEKISRREVNSCYSYKIQDIFLFQTKD